jgi:hypothetical protein
MNSLSNGYGAEVSSRLVDGGFSEDGEQVYNELFHLWVINDIGDRWESYRTFETLAEAEAYLPRVTAALEAGADPRESTKWFLTHPVYASEAYVTYGEAEEVAWEAQMDGR